MGRPICLLVFASHEGLSNFQYAKNVQREHFINRRKILCIINIKKP